MTDDKYHTYLKQKHSKFGVSPEVVEASIKKAIGSEVSESSRVIAGEVNEVYDVKTEKGSFIVRISHGDEDRFTPEKWAIDKAREVGVPAPEVLLIDEVEDQKKKVRVAVESKLPGKSLGDSQLPQDETRKIVVEAGEILAKIHSITPKKFGRLHEGGIGGHESWESYMLRLRQQQVKGLLKSAQKAGISKDQIDKALQILGDHIEQYQGVTPHLLHGDYGPKHILVEDGQVSGILDFENATSGDPIYDFAWWSYFGKKRPSIEWLKEGYEKVAELPNDFELRLRLGRLRLGMDMIWYYDHEGHELGMKAARINLQEDLEYFQSH